MNSSICISCRQGLRTRYHQRLTYLRWLRNGQRSLTSASDSPKAVKSWYWDTKAPSHDQLLAASHFFKTFPPHKLWTATEWRAQNDESPSLVPEVVFLGRSNVGKSSLINAVLASPGLNRVGPRPGKTTLMHAWALAAVDPKTGGALKGAGGDMEDKLTVLDMPGYGHASRTSWGDEIGKYIKRRKHLRRAFILLDPSHGVKAFDMQMLQLLRLQGIPHQVVVSKCDRFKTQGELDQAMSDIRNYIHGANNEYASLALGEMLAVGNLGDGTTNADINTEVMHGVADVQWAVLRAGGLEALALSKARKDKIIQDQKPQNMDPAEQLLRMLNLSSQDMSRQADTTRTSINAPNLASTPAPFIPKLLKPSQTQNSLPSYANSPRPDKSKSATDWGKSTNSILSVLAESFAPSHGSVSQASRKEQSSNSIRDALLPTRRHNQPNTRQNSQYPSSPHPLLKPSQPRSPPQTEVTQPSTNTIPPRTLSQTTPPSPPLSPAVPKGKAVGQGIDALLAMTGASTPTTKPNAKKSSSTRSRTKARTPAKTGRIGNRV